jgi:hypothetical protein
MAIPPERRDLLKILPPELIETLRQPLPIEARRQLIQQIVSEQLSRLQALRYTEEQRRLAEDEPLAHDPAPLV